MGQDDQPLLSAGTGAPPPDTYAPAVYAAPPPAGYPPVGYASPPYGAPPGAYQAAPAYQPYHQPHDNVVVVQTYPDQNDDPAHLAGLCFLLGFCIPLAGFIAACAVNSPRQRKAALIGALIGFTIGLIIVIVSNARH